MAVRALVWSLGAENPTELGIWWVEFMYRLKVTSTEKQFIR